MSTPESFPSPEDWDELLAEMESDATNPKGIVHPEPQNFGKPVEPDWDSLIEG